MVFKNDIFFCRGELNEIKITATKVLGWRQGSRESWWAKTRCEVRKKDRGSPCPKSRAESPEPASLEGQGGRATSVHKPSHNRA